MAKQIIKIKDKIMMKELFLSQFRTYPNIEIKDMVKALYQSEFGGGHLVHNENEGFTQLLTEMDRICKTDSNENLVELIGYGFCRVHLSQIQNHGISVKTLFKLFMLSNKFNYGNNEIFEAKLDYFQELCDVNILPFNSITVKRFLHEYKKSGFVPMHHSGVFRNVYKPAYRVIKKDYCTLLPVLSKIDQLLAQKPNLIVAIDGNSSAGKTTLSSLLKEIYDCNVLHMDSFFLRPNQRNKSRLTEPGGNIDYERFYSAVMKPLSNNESFSYSPFSCKTQTLTEPIYVNPKCLNIIEGVYSMHPKLSNFYDFSIFLTIDFETQKTRILKRNGADMQKRFIEEWIPMENIYFTNLNVPQRCDIVLDNNKLP